MRILYHHRTSGRGAQGVHITGIRGALRALGHKVETVAPEEAQNSQKQSFTNKERFSVKCKKRLPVAIINVMELLYNVILACKLLRKIKAFKPSFVYERYALLTFAGVIAAKLSRTPIILEVNSAFAHLEETLVNRFFSRIARYIELYVVNSATVLITVSAVLRDYLTDLDVDGRKIFVSHNAVNPDHFYPNLSTRKEARTKFGLTDTVVVGYCGYFLTHYEILLPVIEKVSQSSPDIHFLFLGGDEQIPVAKQMLLERKLLNKVTFVPRVPHHEVPFYLSAFDIGIDFAHPFWESPLKIFEYMGMAVPVVAPKTDAIQEVITHGENGFLYKLNNADELVANIKLLAEDDALRKRLGKNAFLQTHAQHTWARNAQQILNIYQGLYANSRDFRGTKDNA